MIAKVGMACGVCPRCGRKICRPRPADIAVCDCWMYCPLDGKKMTPFNPATYPFYPHVLSLDGVDDYIKIGDVLRFEERAPFSIEFWAKDNGENHPVSGGIIVKYGSGEGWMVHKGSYANAYYLKRGEGGVDDVLTLSYVPQQWNHIAFVYDGSYMLGYRNGSFSAYIGSTRNIQPTPNVPLRIGVREVEVYYKGLLDEIRIYNRALTTQEIIKRYKGEPAGEDALVLWMHFNEKTAKDYSGQDNDGTVYGAEFVEGGRPIKGAIPMRHYDSDKGLDVVMWHNSPNDHTQPYYSKQKPIEVHLT